mmetsp:Transcript_20959/g.34623  ORF Transcript_20959/g.34623 Transcript_20959/m.34623 type:complete len:958 (-) Transcript_20959:266-3139(-)|eukprot:CAMPEP_0119341136 /NCGR_PEP_ID=MMETSP1333-20130426/101704_1 /TAXON_ID=418940 /ORGANISM="Scyphosphaera apsteinii, Strain RCC1455" /LENGTH=957 /DNA_ID=CAMNT_0007353033 /DNA_START=53 /DNA_END=2926 /DNA_ORIENTATION=-
MPLRFDIKRKLSSRSDRVKGVDLHPTEPWVLSAMYNGHCFLWNYNTQALVKSFEVSDQPVRAGKFVARKQWIVVGSDDMQIRVYNYNTMERVKVFEAHSDYIRCLAVHPSQPLVLSSSDDMTIRLWDWDKTWTNTMTFEGHSHYVMMVAFNPKDANTFASASLDRTIKVWGLQTLQPHFTLEGHDKGVNCVEYFAGGDRPYLVSGADDNFVKVWDYQTKQCVQTMEGHTHNVASVCCHPELPIILSGSEDGTVRIWHANTYRLEYTLNYAFERCWSIAALRGSNNVCLGYDEGTVCIQLGNEEPIASMDASGKIILARHNEISVVDIKKMEGDSPADGERLVVPAKELDVCEIYPQWLAHNTNGRFAVVTGDGEFIIYTAVAWRKRTFGTALDFVWALDSGEYAVRESPSVIKIFKNFKETRTFKPPFQADAIYGGALLGVRSGEVTFFFDWAECRLVRRIDVQPKEVRWSESGELVCLACEDSLFLLRYKREVVAAAFDAGDPIGEEGVDDTFDLVHEISEQVRTCIWVGDCLLYTSMAGRLNYTVGGEVVTLHHLDRPLYIVGYLPKENRVYLVDRDYAIVSYQLLLSVLQYQTAVVRRDFEAAAAILPTVPREEHNRVARFLEAQGFKEEALAVATDPEHQFELAVQLGKLQQAYEISIEQPSEARWKQLGDLALLSANLPLAEECLVRATDLAGLLLLYSSTGHAEGMEKLAQLAKKKGRLNISFICSFLRSKIDDCLELLLGAGRAPEAAFLARTYAPKEMPRMVRLWREQLKAINPKAADSIADPEEYGNLFDGLEYALKAEEWLQQNQLHEAAAIVYPEHANDNESDLIEHMKLLEMQPPPEAPPEMQPAPEAPPEEELQDSVVDDAQLAPPVEPEPQAATQADTLEAELERELEAELEAAPLESSEPEAALTAELEAELAAGMDDNAAVAIDGDLSAELDAELEAELSR